MKAKKKSSSRNPNLLARRPCNLCGNLFPARSRFSRFCSECKAEKDVVRFADWLPSLSLPGLVA